MGVQHLPHQGLDPLLPVVLDIFEGATLDELGGCPLPGVEHLLPEVHVLERDHRTVQRMQPVWAANILLHGFDSLEVHLGVNLLRVVLLAFSHARCAVPLAHKEVDLRPVVMRQPEQIEQLLLLP